MDARETGRIAAAVFDAKKYELRTHVFVKVLEYDAENNAVKVQQIRKAIRFTDAENIETVELSPLTEVIVRQVGSGKLWLTVAPQPDTYGYLHISDRDVDAWREAGGADTDRIVEPTDTRCMDLRDAVFEPSLVHLGDDEDYGKFVEPIKTDRISLRTRSGLTEISVLDDESIYVNVNDGNATVTIDADGNVSITSVGDVSIEGDGDLSATMGGNVTTDATETVIQAGTDYAVQFTAMKTAFDNLKNELNALVTAYNAHTHITTATAGIGPPGVVAPTTSTGTPPAASMDSAKVDEVRLP